MGKKGSVKNYERPLSPQELSLLETQNEQLKKGIDIAGQQDNRSQEQYDIWKSNYLPNEIAPQMSTRQEELYARDLDNQMPRYAEDTSGVMNRPLPPQGQYPQGSQGKGV